MTTTPAITPAQLHAALGAANKANLEDPQNWQVRGFELLLEKHDPDIAESAIRRIAALTLYLQENPTSPLAYAKAGAVSLLPDLFEAAASCPLNDRGRFDPEQLARLCAGSAPSESQPEEAGNPVPAPESAVAGSLAAKTSSPKDVSWFATLFAAVVCGGLVGGVAIALKAVL